MRRRIVSMDITLRHIGGRWGSLQTVSVRLANSARSGNAATAATMGARSPSVAARLA
jgi:hypothetical protein